MHTGKSLAESSDVLVVQFQRKKHRLAADALENQSGERTCARAEFDHGPSVPQITAAQHRLSQRRGTGRKGADSRRFPQESAEKPQPFVDGRIEFFEKAD